MRNRRRTCSASPARNSIATPWHGHGSRRDRASFSVLDCRSLVSCGGSIPVTSGFFAASSPPHPNGLKNGAVNNDGERPDRAVRARKRAGKSASRASIRRDVKCESEISRTSA